MIQELVNDSYEKCFQREMETLFDDFEFDGDCGTETSQESQEHYSQLLYDPKMISFHYEGRSKQSSNNRLHTIRRLM